MYTLTRGSCNTHNITRFLESTWLLGRVNLAARRLPIGSYIRTCSRLVQSYFFGIVQAIDSGHIPQVSRHGCSTTGRILHLNMQSTSHATCAVSKSVGIVQAIDSGHHGFTLPAGSHRLIACGDIIISVLSVNPSKNIRKSLYDRNSSEKAYISKH